MIPFDIEDALEVEYNDGDVVGKMLVINTNHHPRTFRKRYGFDTMK